MSTKKVVIVGAGPGGLTSAMILAAQGVEVHVFEKKDRVGGRNGSMTFDGYTFDIGPTFLMMRFILDEVFALAGRRTEDYLDIRRIDPLYRLLFKGGVDYRPTHDRAAMKEQIDRLFPGNWEGYQRFLDYEKRKYERLVPCLQVPYGKVTDFFKLRLMKALPYLDAPRSLYDQLGRYFSDERLKTAFTFQAKYLGMSPWECPALFSMISYIEHTGGIHHPIGGLYKISEAMAQVAREHGATFRLNTGIKQVLLEGRRAVGVELESGEKVMADDVVLNADFGHAMTHLVPKGVLRRWSPEKLEKKHYSCSTFMLYLGVDTTYDLPHHNILFADDYELNVREIAEHGRLPVDPSIYVQNASVTDPTLAPKGHSAIYVLVPTPNNRAGIDWEREKGAYREKVLTLLETRGGFKNLRQHIRAERMITPADWENKHACYAGATFNLGHNIGQMLYFRPHNRFEELDNVFLVGGGTHPGSGLPTIYESGRISSELILRQFGRTLALPAPQKRPALLPASAG